MQIGEILAARRKERGLSQMELAQALTARGCEVSNQAVSKWEKSMTLPNARQFLALCEALEIADVRGEFSEGRAGLLSGLNQEGRRRAQDYIQLLRESGRYALQPVLRAAEPLRRLPLYTLPVSAGTGQFLDGEDYEMVEVGAEVPDGSNFGVRVTGDSMEPRFHDGQTVWVRQQRSLMTGEIGIFLYDGNAYLKQLVARDGHVALHSLNPHYPDIPISDALPLRVLGKVLTA
ncbi:MAG: helix-turn-helix domain-containing protein [Oscillospiraceae bacterium]|nr:helix-turn-helix domain-containing protein [Oscillospiraceae bacterium]